MSWRLAPGWGVVDRPQEAEHGGRLYASCLVDGPIVTLEGPAAVVARAVLSGKDLTEVRRWTAQALGVPDDDVDEAAVHELVAELVGLGLLVD